MVAASASRGTNATASAFLLAALQGAEEEGQRLDGRRPFDARRLTISFSRYSPFIVHLIHSFPQIGSLFPSIYLSTPQELCFQIKHIILQVYCGGSVSIKTIAIHIHLKNSTYPHSSSGTQHHNLYIQVMNPKILCLHYHLDTIFVEAFARISTS